MGLHAAPLTVVVFALTLPALSSDWPHWRGPTHNGAAEASQLPDVFDQTRNVVWRTPLPGPAGSTPIVARDRVFLSSFDRSSGSVVAIAIDRASGKELWRVALGAGEADDGQPGMENYMASPSPVADSERVIFYTGRGDLAAFDHAGKPLWSWNVQKRYGGFNYMWGYGASPLLFDGVLILQVLHRDTRYGEIGAEFELNPDSFLLGIEPQTGKVLYRQGRSSGARGESREAYSTPVPLIAGARREFVVLGGDCVTGHDPETGRELWRFGDWNPERISHWRTVTSAVVGDGLVFASAPKFGPVVAVASGEGGAEARWRLERNTTDTPTPLFYKEHLYVLNGKRRVLSCLDPKSGEVLARTRLPRARYIRASPTAGDGKIFIMNADGDVAVVEAYEAKAAKREPETPAVPEPPRPLAQWIDAALLDEPVENLDGRDGIHAWRSGGGLPAAVVNTTNATVKIPGTMPPRTLAVHPPNDGGVAVGWRSPIAGVVSVELTLHDAHDCGDSVAWALDAIAPGNFKKLASGEVNRGGRIDFPASVDVQRGDMVQLSILPKADYGCDLTRVGLAIETPSHRWELAGDLVSRYLDGNPSRDSHGNEKVWHFYKVASDRGLGASEAEREPVLGRVTSSDVPELKLLHEAEMGGYPARSSIAIAANRLFIRTADALYCIGK